MSLISKFTKKTTNTAVEEVSKAIKEKASKYKPILIGFGMLIFGIMAWNGVTKSESDESGDTIFIQNNSTTIYFNQGGDK